MSSGPAAVSLHLLCEFLSSDILMGRLYFSVFSD